MLMHELTNQLSATKENAQRVKMISPLCCEGWERTENSSPSSCQFSWGMWASYSSSTQSRKCAVDSKHDDNWWKLANTMITKSSPLYAKMILLHQLKKKGGYSSKCLRWLCPSQLKLSCSQQRQRLLVPAEVSALRWRGDAAADSFRNCLSHRGRGFLWLWACYREVVTRWSSKHKVVAWNHPTKHLTWSAEQSTRKSSAMQKCGSISLPLIHMFRKRKMLFLIKKAPNL